MQKEVLSAHACDSSKGFEPGRGIKIPMGDEEQFIADFAQATIRLNEDCELLGAMAKNTFKYSKQFVWEEKTKNMAETFYPSRSL
ncbi:hypothetical protein R3X28_15040 [Maribacter sp. TH_r10]|uniref:hypothetical protein n=1 Tax=Maribacter sp. TH_r10 TaxID=3082086 RepID=UPI002954A2D3|nr:hypothetical protein [Maribacter sp. TH_r10]MDV7140206.1 hypothetical protein [Maribacter sp. TH_r10]